MKVFFYIPFILREKGKQNVRTHTNYTILKTESRTRFNFHVLQISHLFQKLAESFIYISYVSIHLLTIIKSLYTRFLS